MFENKINELEKELAKKNSSVSELKRQLKETSEREEEAQISIRRLQDQVINADKGVSFLLSCTESENSSLGMLGLISVFNMVLSSG